MSRDNSEDARQEAENLALRAAVQESAPGGNTRLQKWADPAMFTSEKLSADEGPKVYLLQAPADPLGAVAAACKMYKGEVVRNLATVTDDERRDYLAQVLKTRLQMPFETVQFHFLLEGVTRSFTHQLVRQRTAAYAQESLRFAVVEDDLQKRVALPPYLAGTVSLSQWAKDMSEPDGNPKPREYMERNTSALQDVRNQWDDEVGRIGRVYQNMIEAGMPAEDARALLPHGVTTRVHYITNLRGLLDHAGNRLCTQAQFEWRLVFSRIAEAVRTYNPYADVDLSDTNFGGRDYQDAHWQYEALAELFRPICYATGKCEFKADFDRACKIRDRVDAFAANNVPSSEWGNTKFLGLPRLRDSAKWTSMWADTKTGEDIIPEIRPAEWLLDPGAAR